MGLHVGMWNATKAGIVSVMAAAMLFACVPAANAAQMSSSSSAGTLPDIVQSPQAGQAQAPGLALSSADSKALLSNVIVDNVQAHTADVSFDWDLTNVLNGTQKISYLDAEGDLQTLNPSDIEGMCFQITVGRATDITPSDRYHQQVFSAVPDFSNCGASGSVNDANLTSDYYQKIFGMKTDQDGTSDSADIYAKTVSYQSFKRTASGSFNEMSANGATKGHYTIPLIGLEANTLYGNTVESNCQDSCDVANQVASFRSAVEQRSRELYAQGVQSKTKIDVRRLQIGIQLKVSNSSSYVEQCNADVSVTDKGTCRFIDPTSYLSRYGNNLPQDDSHWDDATAGWAYVPDFHTMVEPTPYSSSDDLPGKLKDSVSVDNGVAKAEQQTRIYLKNKPSSSNSGNMFWYVYVYDGTPKKIHGTDGSPYVIVKKDKSGRYYVDGILPKSTTGDHVISVVDKLGTVCDWGTVSVVPSDSVLMFRLYNKYTGEHFYTSAEEERDALVKIGWRNENLGWVAPRQSGVKVYRLYNPYVTGGDHHYTSDEHERDALVRAGWRYEGVGWYSGGETPVYRQYNPNAKTGTHNYTTSKVENDALVKLGWRAEGTGWYAVM